MIRDSRAKDDKPKRKPRNAERSMLSQSKYKDRTQGKVSEGPNYIDVKYLEAMRAAQDTQCYWCGVKMDPVNRKQKCGMTVDRLDSGPHLKGHCVMACFSCNAKSYRYGWNPYPQRLSKILKLPLDEKNYFSPKKSAKLMPNRLTVARWARLQEELLLKQPIASCL